jgi:acyl-CoA synthetase (AMP-forming)/AMP-acid ligase II
MRYDPLAYLRANAAAHGERLAIYDDGREISFTELLGAVRSLVRDLRGRGLRAGEVVAVALPNVWRYVALEIAVPAAGGVLLPMPMTLGRREVAGALRRTGAKLFVGDGSPELATAAREHATVLHADELDVDGEMGAQAHPADPDRVVQIALTSGTTGQPKLASLTARLKQLTFEGFTARLGFTRDDRMLPLSPVTQGAGEMCLYALRTGAALIMSHDARFSAERALALAESSRATVLGGVPTMVLRLLQSPAVAQTDLSRVRATISAGAPLPPAVARGWEECSGSRTCSFYGAMDIGQLAVPSPGDPAEKRWTTVGRPHETAETLICDPTGAPLAAGEEGEICMRGPLVQDRYWGESHGPYSEDGWAHFGDLGFLDADGYVHVTGRIKDTIIRGGANVNPFEVEELLRGCPSVADVCVVGRPDPDLGERAVAFVVPEGEPAPALADLTGHLEREGLARYKWPESVRVLDALPVGGTGKLDRRALRALAAEGG